MRVEAAARQHRPHDAGQHDVDVGAARREPRAAAAKELRARAGVDARRLGGDGGERGVAQRLLARRRRRARGKVAQPRVEARKPAGLGEAGGGDDGGRRRGRRRRRYPRRWAVAVAAQPLGVLLLLVLLLVLVMLLLQVWQR